jgi:hypothetical protein
MLRIAIARAAPPDFLDAFCAWCAQSDARSDEDVRDAISRWVAEYDGAREQNTRSIERTAA